MSLIQNINTYIIGPFLPLLLVFSGLYFTFSLKFFPFLHPIKTFSTLCRKSAKSNGVSPLKSVMLALAGTIGVGNISGVATALVAGGPGAIFWMWVSAFLLMLVKYSEILLAVKFRQKGSDGFYGGAYYYIRNAFQNKQRAKKISCFFAILCILNSFFIGNIVQVNAISDTLKSVHIPPLAIIFLFIPITYYITRHNIRFISTITAWLTPIMSSLFIGVSMYIILSQRTLLPEIFSLIFKNAFSFPSVTGGICGYSLSQAIRFGTIRGVLSNEAGSGTAPTAHSAADAISPADQGVWGIFEVFADTIVICTMTALVILLACKDSGFLSLNGTALSLYAYSYFLGNWAQYLLGLCVIFFAYATIICWSYYGKESLKYLTPNPRTQKYFQIIYSTLIVPGAVMSLDSIFEITDLIVGLMTFINLIALFKFLPLIRSITKIRFGSDS